MSDPQMLFRSAEDWADLEIRAEGEEGVVFGIAVPWDRPTRINAQLTEEFASGAFDAQMKRGGPRSVFLARDHIPMGGTPLGRLRAMRNDAKGLYIEAPVSRTQIGEETLTLVRDGVLDSFSIGFVEGQNQHTSNGVVRRLTASLREVAIVLNPAYKDAVLAGVRSTCTCGAGGEHEADAEHALTRSAQLAGLLASLPDLPPVPRSFARN